MKLKLFSVAGVCPGNNRGGEIGLHSFSVLVQLNSCRISGRAAESECHSDMPPNGLVMARAFFLPFFFAIPLTLSPRQLRRLIYM